MIDELGALPGARRVEALACDLSSLEGIRSCAEQLRARESHVDVLVNNSGTNWAAPVDSYPEAGWDKVMALNVKTPFFLTQALLPLLEARAAAEAPSRVINIGSIDGVRPAPMDTFAYGASKVGRRPLPTPPYPTPPPLTRSDEQAALHHVTKMLARALAPRHVTVNAIAPGPFRSRMMRVTLERLGDLVAQSTALGRLGDDGDVAGVALWLASPAGGYVTGVVVVVDGGSLVKTGGAL